MEKLTRTMGTMTYEKLIFDKFINAKFVFLRKAKDHIDDEKFVIF